jgi:hypothetical protein
MQSTSAGGNAQYELKNWTTSSLYDEGVRAFGTRVLQSPSFGMHESWSGQLDYGFISQNKG